MRILTWRRAGLCWIVFLICNLLWARFIGGDYVEATTLSLGQLLICIGLYVGADKVSEGPY